MADVELLARDVWPAEVLTPAGDMLKNVRVFATSHRLVAYGVMAEGGIYKVLDVELTVPESIPRSRSSLTGSGRLEAVTPQGTFWVNRGVGCGCHGPHRILKALGPPVPWTPER